MLLAAMLSTLLSPPYQTKDWQYCWRHPYLLWQRHFGLYCRENVYQEGDLWQGAYHLARPLQPDLQPEWLEALCRPDIRRSAGHGIVICFHLINVLGMFCIDTFEEEVGLDISHLTGVTYFLLDPMTDVGNKYKLFMSKRNIKIPAKA